MFQNLTGLGWTIVSFTILVVVGLVVVGQLGAGVASTSPVANSTAVTMQGYLGTSSGGLASWTPAIIAITIGVLFLGMFGFGGRKKY